MNRYFGKFFLIIFLINGKLFAQTDSLKPVTLSDVTVSENRIRNIPLARVSQDISIIGKKQIQERAARSLQEVLSFEGGVDVRQRGPLGVQADIGIRGGTYEQTLMLVNGIKMSDPQTGHHMVNIPVPLMSVERVDVLKGPGARIFGQNAFSGAVNIITSVPDSSAFALQLYGGDFSAFGGNVYASLPLGKYRQTLSVSRDQSAGYWYNSDFRINNLLYENAVRTNSRNEFRGMFGYSGRDFGANGYYSNRFPDQWESTGTLLSSVSHQYKSEKFSLQSRAYWRRNEDEFRLKRNDPDFYTNTHVSQVKALELNAGYRSDLGITGLGAEVRSESIRSSNLGNHERNLFGLFLEHRLEWAERFDLRAGIYSNYYDEYGWKHFPGAEFGWQFTGRSRLFVNAGKSFRIPTYTELYYQDPSNSSNPDLLPEEAVSMELGYRYHRKNVKAAMAVFRRSSDNMIDYFRPSSDSAVNPNKWTPMNLAHVNFSGFEMNIYHAFSGGSGWVKLRSASISYTYLDASFSKSAGEESRYALTALRHQLVGGVQFLFWDRVDLNISGRYISRISYDPYLLLDARINARLSGKMTMFAEASNISNTDYVEAGFVQMPGRWFRSGIQMKFK